MVQHADDVHCLCSIGIPTMALHHLLCIHSMCVVLFDDLVLRAADTAGMLDTRIVGM